MRNTRGSSSICYTLTLSLIVKAIFNFTAIQKRWWEMALFSTDGFLGFLNGDAVVEQFLMKKKMFPQVVLDGVMNGVHRGPSTNEKHGFEHFFGS